jgi:glycosyltransferase involved in cell wall biosynthesis
MTRNCRLLYLVGQLGVGGLERQLYFLLRAMDRERYLPEVVTWNLNESDVYVPRLQGLAIPLHSFPKPYSGAAKVKALRRLVGRIRPEIVHSYSFYTNFAAWWATLGTTSIPIGAVQSDFISDKKWSGRWLGRVSARWPRDQIFNSLRAADNARSAGGFFTPRRPFVVRNGLDLGLFRNTPLSVGGEVRVLAIGSLLPVKRWDRLLRAASELKRQNLPCIVQIAGEGPLREELEREARTLGVGDSVQFIGYVANVQDLLVKATFVVHTSDTEGCPNVVMEAMACGRAVIATDAGDVPTLIDNGRTGFLVRRGDEATLVARMATLISNRDLCRHMGQAGQAKADREFGVERLVSETMAVYRSVGWRDE